MTGSDGPGAVEKNGSIKDGSNIWTNLPSGDEEVQEVEEVDTGEDGSPTIYVPVEKKTKE